MEIKNKVVIVTGASQGIGRATAKYLAEKEAYVVLSARSDDKLRELEKELPGSFAVVTDMRDPDDIENLIERTMEKYGRVDILINNAGQGLHGTSVEDLKIDEYQEVIELNLFGPIKAMQTVIPIMRKQGGGMIINVSSGTAKMHLPFIAGYSSTKYALVNISLAARKELEADNIIVSVIYPRITATNFYKNVLGRPPEWENGAPPMWDPAEKVAEKIGELIRTEEAEMSV